MSFTIIYDRCTNIGIGAVVKSLIKKLHATKSYNDVMQALLHNGKKLTIPTINY